MAKSIYSEQYTALRSLLITERKQAGLSQQALADKLERPQSFVSKFELGERRLDVVEFLDVIRAIGADPCVVIERLVRNEKSQQSKSHKRR